MLIFRLVLLFWVPTRIGFLDLMLEETHLFSLYCPTLQECIPPLSLKRSVSPAVSLRAPAS